MMTHHFVMTSSLLIKIKKIDNFGDFSCDIDYNSWAGVFRDVISLIINRFIPSAQRAPPADTKCPPAAQRKQAKRVCIEKIAKDLTMYMGIHFILLWYIYTKQYGVSRKY